MSLKCGTTHNPQATAKMAWAEKMTWTEKLARAEKMARADKMILQCGRPPTSDNKDVAAMWCVPP